jgi:hypothetical protein
LAVDMYGLTEDERLEYLKAKFAGGAL